MPRRNTFRIAVRKYHPFEQAIASQWAAFEAEAHTGLTLEAVPMDLHPLEDSLFTSGGMKNGAWDVCFIATDWIAAMHSSGAALDLAPLLAEDPVPGFDQGAWPDSLLRLQRFQGSILGTPYHDGPECLIYRKDLFSDPARCAAYESQFNKPLTPPLTWQDFHRIARFFHAPAKNLYGAVFAAFPDAHNSVYDFLLQLWTRGGTLFDTNNQARFNTPEAASALTFYRAILTDSTAVHPHCKDFDSIQAGLAFARGEAAMMINWFGFATMTHTSPSSVIRGLVDIAGIPSDSGRPTVSLNVYWILAIAAGSPHPDIAWRFLQHCLTPAMDKLTTTSGAIGCRKSTWTDADVNAAIPFYHRMESLHAVAREIPQRPDWPTIAAIIDKLVVNTITTSEPIESLLQHADQQALSLQKPYSDQDLRL